MNYGDVIFLFHARLAPIPNPSPKGEGSVFIHFDEEKTPTSADENPKPFEPIEHIEPFEHLRPPKPLKLPPQTSTNHLYLYE